MSNTERLAEIERLAHEPTSVLPSGFSREEVLFLIGEVREREAALDRVRALADEFRKARRLDIPRGAVERAIEGP